MVSSLRGSLLTNVVHSMSIFVPKMLRQTMNYSYSRLINKIGFFCDVKDLFLIEEDLFVSLLL